MQRNDVIAPRTFEVVVLAVDVCSDCAANGDIASARCYRDEQTLWHECVQEPIDTCAGIGGHEHRVGGRIRFMNCERSDIGGFDDRSAGVLGRVAVAAAKAARNQAALERGGKRALQFDR